MFKYVVQRLTMIIVSLFLIILLTFSLMHMAPGSPFSQDRKLSPKTLKSLNEYYGLDKPVIVQFKDYLVRLTQFDLGVSTKYVGRRINKMIGDGIPASFTLAMQAIIFSTTFGVLLGVISALNHNKWPDYLAMVIAVLGISVPSFVMATFLQLIFSVKLGWFPIALFTTYKHTILPSIALSFGPMAFISRLMRSSMLEVIRSDYIRTAHAKGLNKTRVFFKHQFRNAILPVVTYLGPLTAGVLTGSLVIEKIFAIPGIGKMFILGIGNRDYSLIMGMTIFYSFLLLMSVFIVDIVYGYIDPRIVLSKTRKVGDEHA